MSSRVELPFSKRFGHRAGAAGEIPPLDTQALPFETAALEREVPGQIEVLRHPAYLEVDRWLHQRVFGAR